jgi:Sulfotransferase domain
MIIWLASYPRSGNTMARIVCHKVYGLLSYSLYEERPWENGHENLASVMGSAGQVTEAGLDELRRRPERCLVKTHGLPLDDSPALCLIRDGRDALVSYAHFIRTYEAGMAQRFTFEQMLRLLITSRDHFGGWSDNIKAWRTRTGTVIWLRYEDLIRAPQAQLERVLRQLGVGPSPTDGPPVDFADLNRRWPEFFRKGKIGSWREEMNEELHELFWRHHHEPMRWFGYRRSPDRKSRDEYPLHEGC